MQITIYSYKRLVIFIIYKAMFSGRGFNREIQQTVMETQIEDLWIPYFAISTDLTVSRMRVHTCGSLWRYVRGSMTLTGYLPPICDPRDGHYLVDGGYINNLPVDVAKTRGANIVLAIDVGAREDANLHNYGDYISGWYLLWQKWWPWAKTLRIPDLNEIQSRLAYIANNHLLEEFINSDACVYMRIENIDKFATMGILSISEFFFTSFFFQILTSLIQFTISGEKIRQRS